MKRIFIAVIIIMLLMSSAACEKTSAENPKKWGENDSQSSQPAAQPTKLNVKKDKAYYLGFDEGYVDIDTAELELEIDVNVVKILEYNPDWIAGITIGFETNAHEKPVYINYDGYGCFVEYYDYPNKKSLIYTSIYYAGPEEGDWDGMGKFVEEETHYYENGQIEKHIVRDVKEDEATYEQTIYIVTEEYFDEAGNEVEQSE